MKVFRLKPDYNYSRFYTWDPNSELEMNLYSSDLLGIGGTRRGEAWEPLTLYPDEPQKEWGDFAYLLSCNFAISEQALAILRPLLKPCCEFLPLVPYNDKAYYLLNVLNCFDCLDHEATTWVPPRPDPGKPEAIKDLKSISIDEYSFDAKNLPESALFRIPEERNVGELTVSGLFPAEQEFKSIVESERLTGLKFEEIWSEDGPRIGRNQRLKTALGF